jgi:PKD repeat protein
MNPRTRRAVARGILAALFLLLLCGCAFYRPTARISAQPNRGLPPLHVQFDGRSSSSPRGTIVDYRWSFGDSAEAAGDTVRHTFLTKGSYEVTLTVTDSEGGVGSATMEIVVVNVPPRAFIEARPEIQSRGIPIDFDGTDSFDADGEIIEYRWEFDDGSVGYGPRVAHDYSETGVYLVKLTVVDDDGEEASVYQVIRIVGCGSC